MDEIRERLIAVRKNLGLKQIEFSEKLGITSAAISSIELGKSPLTEANIRLICLTFRVNEEWLRYGTGEMQDDEAALSDEEKKLLDVFRDLSPIDKKKVIEYTEERLALQVLKADIDKGFKLGTEGKMLVIENEDKGKGQNDE